MLVVAGKGLAALLLIAALFVVSSAPSSAAERSTRPAAAVLAVEPPAEKPAVESPILVPSVVRPKTEVVEPPPAETPPAGGFPTAIDTAAFERLRFAGVPARIVSLTPGVTETLFALGVGPRVVGVSRYCDHPEEVSTLPRVGSFLAPVIEAVIKLEPDIVITSPSPGNRNAVEALERAGLRVEVVGEGSESLDAIRDSIRTVSKLVGRVMEGALLLNRIDSALDRVRDRVSALPKPRVAVVVGYEPLVLAGPSSYLGELVHVSGGINIAEKLGGKWPRTGLEFLLAANPEIIIDASTQEFAQDEVGTITRRWSQFPVIAAVADGHIYGHGGFLLLRPGPRLAEQALLMGRYVHPE